MSRYYSVLVITVVVINGLHCITERPQILCHEYISKNFWDKIPKAGFS